MFKMIFSEMGISESSPDDIVKYLKNIDGRKEVLETGSKLLSSLDILNNLTC